jgi:hypothetical protein
MKNIILSLFLLIFNNSIAQCDFTLDELLNLMVANASEYETIALTKGYRFDSEKNLYYCIKSIEDFAFTKRSVLGEYIGFLYLTSSTENYLDIKKRLIEMKFKFSEKVSVDKTEGLLFIANNIYITLFTKTDNYVPNYIIMIQVDVPDKD